VVDKGTIFSRRERIETINTDTMPSVEEAKQAYLDRMAEIARTQDLTEDRREETQNLTIGFTAAAAAFVALRFFARFRQGAYIGVDDWLMLAAMVLLFGNMAMNLVCMLAY
jgi:cysteine synthase